MIQIGLLARLSFLKLHLSMFGAGFYLNAHPYGDGQREDGQEDREEHQEPATKANITDGVVKSCKKKN